MNTIKTLEFDKIISMLKEHALSDTAKTKISNLKPFTSEEEISFHLKETTEAKTIIENFGNPPLSTMNELEKSLIMLSKNILLQPEQFTTISQFIASCRRLKTYLIKAECSNISLSSYGKSIYDLAEVENEIDNCIRNNTIDSNASPLLADIRKKIDKASEQVRVKLNSLLRNNKKCFSEDFVSFRNNHFTLPVKKEYKKNIEGTVIDISQSGNTLFIEPSSISKLQSEISTLKIEENNEELRILYTLMSLVEDNLQSININIEAMENLDYIFAKAKLSLDMKANEIPVKSERKISIKKGKHPLLNKEIAVPLDFYLGDTIQGIIITGPNTGGKTVALKTIGLLSLMAQCGLHIPAKDGYLTINNYILCDIGDGQSITENLSTFSAHMTNIIKILSLTDSNSLVLLDELGSGTDPAEGMGLAITIIEELLAKKCLFVATTHYPEIKEYANEATGLINARMAFDKQSLLPLYQLEIGEAGESCALYIAKRLGLPEGMIERAKKIAYNNNSKHTIISSEINEPYFNNSEKQINNKKKKIKNNSKFSSINNSQFIIGDSVLVSPEKKLGIVYKEINEKGEIGVQIKKEKFLINHKRLKLHVSANELYPEDYDFSIIFDSVETRKARHQMSRKYDPNLVIEVEK